jgi:type I restriction enzyme M protein
MQDGNWESVIGRLEELVLAGSGEDHFEEIFKLLIAKLYAEREQTAEKPFRVMASDRETAEAINRLLEQSAERWQGILVGSPSMSLSDEHLSVCVRALQGHSLLDTHLEVLDSLFEYLVTQAAKGAKGQYFTPRHVIDCCVKIVNPQVNERVLDPACGSGGFLIHALTHVQESDPGVDVGTYANKRLWGFDFDQRAARVAKAMMLIAGDGATNIFRLNSLLTPEANVDLFALEEGCDSGPRLTIEDVLRSRVRNFKGFDAIITNPPFAGEIQEQGLLKTYEVYREGRRIERDVLFLERCVGLLRPGGRLAIVLPHNKVGSESWAYLREWLLQRVRIVSVVGLGRSTFLPHTHQKTSIIFAIKRERVVRRLTGENILFVVSERDGKDSKGHIIERPGVPEGEAVWRRADHDLDDVVMRFNSFVEAQGIAWSAG